MYGLFADTVLFSWNGINEQVVGDITTFTYSNTHFIVLGVMGVVSTLVGAALLWVTKFSFRDKGYWSYVITAVGLFFLSAPLLIGDHSVVLTPKQVEIDTYGAPQTIPIASIKSIETREDRSGPKRRVTVHYRFHLTDGTSKDFTGGLVGAAVKKLELLNNQGRLNVVNGEPPARNAASSPASSAPPPPPTTTGSSAPTAPTPQPAARSSDIARSRRIDRQGIAAGPGTPPMVNGSSAASIPAVASSVQDRRGPSKHEPSPSAIKVLSDTALEVGTRVEAQWGASYYPAEVLDVLPNDQVRIHYTGWSTATDETVPRARLWVGPSQVAAKATSTLSSPVQAESSPAPSQTFPDGAKVKPRQRTVARKSNGPTRPTREPSASAIKVISTTPIAVGTPVEAQWGSMYYPAEVLELLPDDQVRVHYSGWSSVADETVSRSKIWVEPTAIARKDASGDSIPVEADPAASDMPLTGNAPKIRTWTDVTGKHNVEAEFVDFAGGKVRLKRQDGKIVTMALERLSEADQKLVRSFGATK